MNSKIRKLVQVSLGLYGASILGACSYIEGTFETPYCANGNAGPRISYNAHPTDRINFQVRLIDQNQQPISQTRVLYEYQGTELGSSRS